jgi:hypothetical protein
MEHWTEQWGDQARKNLVKDKVIDTYLSSLRGLVTQFKYAPFLPIKNEYLNRTFGVTGVTMNNLTVSTVEGFPFVLAVQLEMSKFNHQIYLPMIEDFDQAIHWGKFRQYMGRATSRLDSMVNQGFLTEQANSNLNGTADSMEHQVLNRLPENIQFEGDLLPRLDKAADLRDGRYFKIYYPITTPSRIFAPDTTDFRQPNEQNVVTKDYWDGFLSDLGFDLREAPKFDFFEYDTAFGNRAYRNQRKVLFDWMDTQKITYNEMGPDRKDAFIQWVIDENPNYVGTNEDEVRKQLDVEWFFMLYEQLMTMDNPRFQKLMQSRAFQDSNYILNEFRVPMEQLYIDWRYCFVTGVSVSLSNTFAKLPIQMQAEPAHQHLGGGDSRVDVQMTIIGEDNLLRFERLWDHIGGLARLEKAHGVLGFLGIKNVITALCGIKYVLPLNFEVDTMPNFPHVYNVKLSLIDFDVMQQQREQLSSDQQARLVETFGKRNPFLRLKQAWGSFNAYPDLPLDIKDEKGAIIGHFDPDWYFRSFQTTQSNGDIFNWGFDGNLLNLFISYFETKALLDSAPDNADIRYGMSLGTKLIETEQQIRSAVSSGAEVPFGYGYDKESGQVVQLDYNSLDPNSEDFPKPIHIQYLGSHDENQKKLSFISFYSQGFIVLGTEDTETNEREYSLKMAWFDEDNASRNLKNTSSNSSLTPISEYQNEYIDNGSNPNKQYEAMLQDFDYRNLKGRMVKAFPTYMLFLIDEGGRFAGIKLFDNFYGLNSVIDFSVHTSEEPTGDTLVLRVSNVYQKLTTPYKDLVITEDDPLFETPIGHMITTWQNRTRNTIQGLTAEILELNSIRLKPGVRVHLRAGYGANPNALQTVFNGVIAEVQQGDIMTLICQSDALELTGMVNGTNPSGHSGKLDGGINTGWWLSEPRDLMVRLLSMGSSNFKEWIAQGSRGVIFSESRFGIRHFGNILYPYMTDGERTRDAEKKRSIISATVSSPNTSATGVRALLGNYGEQLSEMNSMLDLPGAVFNSDLIQIGKALWLNSVTRRDYEIFKRNIYPGNGTGIAQFMGGDMIDGGITLNTARTFVDKTRPVTPTVVTEEQAATQQDYKDQVQAITEIWESIYDADQNLDVEELMELLRNSNGNANEELPGILDDLLGNDGINWIDIVKSSTVGNATLLNTILSLSPLGPGGGLNIAGKITGIDFLSQISQFYTPLGSLRMLNSGIGKLYNSPLGEVFGLRSMIPDDDLGGFDEVSFRAQTYMKTVWDLFKVCATLLPNYIVAIRPFEDRSTVFYGKPHWLYTSGVVPITLGDGLVNKDGSPKRNVYERPDEALQEAMESAKKILGSGYERLFKLTEESGLLKDIMNFDINKASDPYDVTGSTSVDVTDKYLTEEYVNTYFASQFENVASEELITNKNELVDAIIKRDEKFKYIKKGYFDAFIMALSMYSSASREDLVEFENGLHDSSLLPESVSILMAIGEHTGIIRDNLTDAVEDDWDGNYYKFFYDVFYDFADQLKNVAGLEDTNTVKDLFWTDRHDDDKTKEYIQKALADLAPDSNAQEKILDLLDADPSTFSYQFGWKFSTVPVWVDPLTGLGGDTVGDYARELYDKSYGDQSEGTKPMGDRTVEDAKDIWGDFREKFPMFKETGEAYVRVLPFDVPDGASLEERIPGSHYMEIMDLFMRFLWQDPFNRAWLVVVASREGDKIFEPLTLMAPFTIGPLAFLNGVFGDITDTDKDWNFTAVIPAWEQFLVDDVFIDDQNVVQAPNTRAYMELNKDQGHSADTAVGQFGESVVNWFDENVGQIISMIHDTMVGFVTSIRMSLIQMSSALSMANESQKQSSILNSSLDDSIYYQEGGPGSLLRMADNPFTREYYEPVIEIREPFQRIHFVSSFDCIIDNAITESLDNVVTVVTATSDGKYPVTVHFDKAIPPDRQVEKIIETGIYWDNAVGSGLLGVFHPLIHPLETVRSYTKSASGSADQLTSRRIALAHLKESLKDIYTGEITILGNADIRPHDLLYIADISERMYGLVEVEQVVHHLTPEAGFVTSITPNAVVSVNDPARWTLLNFVWSKLHTYSIRDDVRATLNVRADRELALAAREITSDDVYTYFSTQLQGGLQYTQGNTALIRDMAGMFSGGGIREMRENEEAAAKQIGKIDVALQMSQGVLTAGGAIAGGVITGGSPTGVIAGGVGGWAFSDLVWQGWEWVKNNLLDQHGCYIQFLNKDGQPMDAGLSYYQGVAVGSNHTISLFPNTLGLPGPAVNYMDPQTGSYRITTNDVLGALGWTEIETVSLFRETSMFVNQINKDILIAAGRDFDPIEVRDDNSWFFTAQINSYEDNGVEDGDTLNVTIIDSGNADGIFKNGSQQKIRLAVVNTYEIEHHDNPDTPLDESNAFNSSTDLGKLAQEYLRTRFFYGGATDIDRLIAVRVSKSRPKDKYGRFIGLVFHNAPTNVAYSDKGNVLLSQAKSFPPIRFDAYMEDGRPYTLNWEMVMTGYGNVYMQESIFDTTWRNDAIDYGG